MGDTSGDLTGKPVKDFALRTIFHLTDFKTFVIDYSNLFCFRMQFSTDRLQWGKETVVQYLFKKWE